MKIRIVNEPISLFVARGIGMLYGVEIDDGIFIITDASGNPVILSKRMMVYDSRRGIKRKACRREEEIFKEMVKKYEGKNI